MQQALNRFEISIKVRVFLIWKVVVVVQWSAFLPSTHMIRGRIPLKNENKRKRGRELPINNMFDVMLVLFNYVNIGYLIL